MKYVIINECDGPCRNTICELVDGKYYYMLRSVPSRAYLKRFDGMQPRRPTSIEDFGFSVTELQYQVDFKRVGPSVATYEDGKPRRWQGTGSVFSLPKVQL